MTVNIMPTMRYADAPAAIEWLCDAFGFERHMVVEDGEGGIAHAQLVLNNSIGNGMIMLGSAREDDFGQVEVAATPGQAVTQSAYVIVDDCAALYERAKAAGAEIFMELTDPEYGGQAFGCRDPQGQVWNFGSYNPWEDDGEG